MARITQNIGVTAFPLGFIQKVRSLKRGENHRKANKNEQGGGEVGGGS